MAAKCRKRLEACQTAAHRDAFRVQCKALAGGWQGSEELVVAILRLTSAVVIGELFKGADVARLYGSIQAELEARGQPLSDDARRRQG